MLVSRDSTKDEIKLLRRINEAEIYWAKIKPKDVKITDGKVYFSSDKGRVVNIFNNYSVFDYDLYMHELEQAGLE